MLLLFFKTWKFSLQKTKSFPGLLLLTDHETWYFSFYLQLGRLSIPTSSPHPQKKRKEKKTKRWHNHSLDMNRFRPQCTTENSNPTHPHHHTPAKSIFLTTPLTSTSQFTKQIRIPMTKNKEGAIDRQLRNLATSESPNIQNVRDISQNESI